jgi:hypothetical protein
MTPERGVAAGWSMRLPERSSVRAVTAGDFGRVRGFAADGHTGQPGSHPGYLNDPDGVDLAPPHSLLIRHKTTIGHP